MNVLILLLVLYFFARLFGEFALKIGQPILVGELIAGILLGVTLPWISPTFPIFHDLAHNEAVHIFSELGMFFLMLVAGMELEKDELFERSKSSIGIAIAGMILPFLLGFGMGWLWIEDPDKKFVISLFLGTSLAITAVPVAAKILMDFNLSQTKLGKTLISAAVLDDIMSLILLSFLTSVLSMGTGFDWQTLLSIFGNISIFVIIFLITEKYVYPALGHYMKKEMNSDHELSLIIIMALALGIIAEKLGIHFIIGSFAAGLLFMHQTAGKKVFSKVQHKLKALTDTIFAPIFFISIGLAVDFTAITQIPVFLIIFILLAFVGKLGGVYHPARWAGLNKKDSLLLGVGMSARGAVELIIVGVAMEYGLFKIAQDHPDYILITSLFSATVLMAIVTTFAVPVLMKAILKNKK